MRRMSLVKHSRLPASVILLAGAFVSVAIAVVSRAPVDVSGATAACASVQGADAAQWLTFAADLERKGEWREAAEAYAEVLKQDAYNDEARFRGLLAWAQAGDTNSLLECYEQAVLCNAKLAVRVIDRPEVRRYLSAPGFHQLAQEARSQSMD